MSCFAFSSDIYIFRFRSLSPSSRLKLALVKFFPPTLVSSDVCSKIDLGRASLQSTNRQRERRKKKKKKRLKGVTCSPHPHTQMKRRLTKQMSSARSLHVIHFQRIQHTHISFSHQRQDVGKYTLMTSLIVR